MLRRVMLVEGASELPLLLVGLLLGALVAVPSTLAIPVLATPRGLVPLLPLLLPLGRRVLLVIFVAGAAPSLLGIAASPAGGTAAAGGAVTATVLPRRKGHIQPLHDDGHDILYDLLLSLL